MARAVIQSFLDNNFIKTDNDDHIEHLNTAATEVVKQLNKKKSKLIPFTLVAFDPNVDREDPIVLEICEIITKKWSGFNNSILKTKDTPVTYAQAVLLQGLTSISKDPNTATIIWHTGCNVLSYYKLAGQKKVLLEILQDIGDVVNKEANYNWSLVEDDTFSEITTGEIELPSIASPKISTAALAEHFKAASIYSGLSSEGENENYPSNNSLTWPTFFSNRAAKGLATEINATINKQHNSISEMSSSIVTSLEQFSELASAQLKNITSDVQRHSLSINKRSELIWWKQALYSNILDESYRELPKEISSVVMAIDLSNSITPIYPKSVDYLAKEALRNVAPSCNDSITLTHFIEQLKKHREKLIDIIPSLDTGLDYPRISFTACVTEVLQNNLSVTALAERTNLDLESEVSLSRILMWFLHDLQAIKAVKAK